MTNMPDNESRAGLSHVDSAGRARMVDVGDKPTSRRRAVARAAVEMAEATLAAIVSGTMPKGDVLAVARIAGIAAAKRTDELIPLCHTLPLDGVHVRFRAGERRLEIEAEAQVSGRTGVEMEALTAAGVAALTIYDMCKAIDRGMVITDLRLVRKEGGRTGLWQREGEREWTQQL